MGKGIAEEVIPILSEAHAILQKMGLYDKFLAFLKRQNSYPIIVLGASGTGKTAMLRALAGMPAKVRREDRTDEVSVVKNKLKEIYIEVIDTPGEIEHKSKRAAFARELMKRGSVGVLNVVSHGYHEGKAAQATAVADGKPLEPFLETRRAVELELLKEWIGPLCGKGGCVSWITTVVTKADLWWAPSSEQAVMKYYDSDVYKSAFETADDTPHSVKSFSSLGQLFYDKAPMSGFYSDSRRQEDHAALVAHILAKVAEHG